MSPKERKRILADYFHEYMQLYHQLQLADTDEEMTRIEEEVERIRGEVREKYAYYNKEGDNYGDN